MDDRAALAREILKDGTAVCRERLSALAQAKLAYVDMALDLSRKAGATAFASIVPKAAPRPQSGMLRKDYAYLFERFYYFLRPLHDDADLVGSGKRAELAAPPRNAWRIDGVIRRLRLPGFVVGG